MRSTASEALSTGVVTGISSTNSSPPQRAKRSVTRMWACTSGQKSRSTAWPAGWPKRSVRPGRAFAGVKQQLHEVAPVEHAGELVVAGELLDARERQRQLLVALG